MTHHKKIHTVQPFDSKNDTLYGQFIALSEENEIMCYSRNGNAIYYCEDPPTTPYKNKQSNRNKVYIQQSDIPKYIDHIDTKLTTHDYTINIMYGITTIAFLTIMFIALYIMFVDTIN